MRVRWAAGPVMLVLLLAGCSEDGGGSDPKAAAKPPAEVVITPADGAGKVRPELPVKVEVANGSLQNVSVSTGGSAVEGDLDALNGQWTARRGLDPSTTYQVTATALGQDGKDVSVTSEFTTLTPSRTIAVSAVAPAPKETVGVGMPIILNFDQPVYNQADVEKNLTVKASRPVEGAWRWISRQQVVYRPKEYWPARTDVVVDARFSGVRAAKGVYGTKDLKLRFRIGDDQRTLTNEDTHQMVVKRNGRVLKRFPVSLGMATTRAYTTTNGIHVTMEKVPHVLADSATVGIPKGHPDWYETPLDWTVRISSSGEYTHSAPWSVAQQGRSNVSHGCVNLSEANAKWFYDFSRRGDIYEITGTDRELEWNNGWGYWQLSWKQWKKGSALD
ncbi:L,D-transpeptidase [Actinocorallia populi]|uniref:L,D-transpeptidase n=1 Tax=Actinocorallia populi TaxID=2079200 RepID=UPI001E455495|nr:Ig-like domain-containing protein [Actinocorallia populi]